MKLTITSGFREGSILPSDSQMTVKTEPMLHRATRKFAYNRGGPLTHIFLDALEWDHADEILIDSRVHMLMPGMFPCIPGWHHDDVPRERADRQPEYFNPSYKAQHCMALWGDCSLTEFAVGTSEFEIPDTGKIYKQLHHEVEAKCNSGELYRVKIRERLMTYFDWLTWHRGCETTHRGFRFFIRATRFSNLEVRNEIRYNANVYMPLIEEGW